MPARSVRLASLGVLLAIVAVVLAVWAVSAYRFASEAHHWRSTLGTVIQPDPLRAPPVVAFADFTGSVHEMALKPNDTDDVPVGAVIRVSYQLLPGERVRSEFTVQPGARASALAISALAAAAGSAVAWWRWRVER